MQERVLNLSRTAKRSVVVAMDIVLACIATWLAFTLRLDALHVPTGAQWWVYFLAPALAIPIFTRWGLYRAIFRYTGQAALNTMAKAVGVYTLTLVAILLWQRWPGVPRSLGILQPLIFLLLAGASRALARFWLAQQGGYRSPYEGQVLIYGAGTAGVQTATAMSVSGQFRLAGFIDDDQAMIGRSINNVPVYGASSIARLVEAGVTDILLALPSTSRIRRNEIIATLQSLPVHIRTLPNWADLASGRITVQDFRELDVEDLLGRDPVPPDQQLIASILFGQVVMVTGAGGSIGGELCRQIIQQQPKQLLLFEHNEFGLYAIHQELLAISSSQNLEVELTPLLGSVANYSRILAVCQQYRPGTVYHAAAYKHVPMVESNAAEGIANNVLGTYKAARAAIESSVSRFVLISTDKAVRPTNVMGASKRMAELVLQALAAQSDVHTTCFTMVRFGNVLGSSGSVVPLFRKQLQSGGPITLTHPDVTRYFMTIPEAAQLVLQAGAMATGGDVFLLDMGAPVRIKDLALRMIRLSGLTVKDDEHPDGDIAVEITGLRPGEKLYEELLIGDNPLATNHPRIMKAREHYLSWEQLSPILDALSTAVEVDDLGQIQGILTQCVHGYQPASTLASQTVY